jgi:hypothetical protein
MNAPVLRSVGITRHVLTISKAAHPLRCSKAHVQNPLAEKSETSYSLPFVSLPPRIRDTATIAEPIGSALPGQNSFGNRQGFRFPPLRPRQAQIFLIPKEAHG